VRTAFDTEQPVRGVTGGPDSTRVIAETPTRSARAGGARTHGLDEFRSAASRALSASHKVTVIRINSFPDAALGLISGGPALPLI
jgi:hypothetical protein